MDFIIFSSEEVNKKELIKNKKNVGFGKGHNIVLDKIDSKYHAIVNPDILLQEDSFSAIIKYMEEQQEMGQEVGMVIPRLIDEHGELLKVYRRELTVADLFIRMFLSKWFQKRQAYHTMQNKNYKKEFQVPFGQGSFLVIRTALFKQLKGFDDRYFMYMEDADLCKRVNQVSKFMYFPNTSVIHKWERGSHKNIKLFQYHIQSMIRYFNKWGWKWL